MKFISNVGYRNSKSLKRLKLKIVFGINPWDKLRTGKQSKFT